VLQDKIDVQSLPESLRRFIEKHPEVWEHHEKLGIACLKGGPLPDKTVRIIRMSVSAALGRETAFKTHVRSALKAGATPDEIEHALLQLLPICGLNMTIMTGNWAREVIEGAEER